MNKNRFAFGSWSTFGQTALLVIAALVIVQTLTVVLVRGLIEEWQHSYVEQPTVRRLADVAGQIAAAPKSQREEIVAALSGAGERFWLLRDVQFAGLRRDAGLESRLLEILKKRGLKTNAVIAFRGGFDRIAVFVPQPHAVTLPSAPGDAPRALSLQPVMPDRDEHPLPPSAALDYGPDFLQPGPDRHMRDVLRYAVLLPDGVWLVARFEVMRSFPLFLNPIFLSQAALFIVLLAATLFWASRISRPLRILARAAEGLNPQTQFEPITVQGPRDVQAAIGSFNTMALRVRELLHEKDRMLTAIGHDLRTPLASLRIRAEAIEPEGEREKIIETVDEMTAMVDEILALARLGYSTEPQQLVDLAALADAVVEDFTSIGKAVSFVDSPRTPLPMQVGLMRRLMRNLIDNAVKYGGKAQVSVTADAQHTALVIEDEGPGIPAERMQEVLQPFSRLEHSRSRLTGGSGLGLTIADAIARSQGGSLHLENRPKGGLKAMVTWPHP